MRLRLIAIIALVVGMKAIPLQAQANTPPAACVYWYCNDRLVPDHYPLRPDETAYLWVNTRVFQGKNGCGENQVPQREEYAREFRAYNKGRSYPGYKTTEAYPAKCFVNAFGRDAEEKDRDMQMNTNCKGRRGVDSCVDSDWTPTN